MNRRCSQLSERSRINRVLYIVRNCQVTGAERMIKSATPAVEIYRLVHNGIPFQIAHERSHKLNKYPHLG